VHTLTRTPRIEYTPHLSPATSPIPAGTPEDQLRRLLTRYENLRDPAIAALPVLYRNAISSQLRALLAQSVTGDAA
jgi:hypothetical protein